MDNGACSYRRFLDGDDSGIVEIIRDYKDGLILYLNGFTKNIHVAEDIMSDTFFKLMIKKPRFKGHSTFKTWLYAIGRNEALAYLKKNARHADNHDEDMLADEHDLLESYFKDEQKITVHNAIARLKTEYSQVLYLTFFEDFKNADIAVVMHKNKHQIETLLYRAKKALKKELEKEGFEYEEL